MKLYRIIANPEFELIEGTNPNANRFMLKIVTSNAVGTKEETVRQNPNFQEGENKLILMEFRED